MKAAIVVLSDPKSGTEDALGRLFNALASAYDFKHSGDDVTILFQGAGTRWVGEVSKADHLPTPLFKLLIKLLACRVGVLMCSVQLRMLKNLALI